MVKRQPVPGRTAVKESGLKRPSPHVVASIHPSYLEAGAVAWFACRPAPTVYAEGLLSAGTSGLSISRLVIEPWEPGPDGLTATELRSVRLPAILGQAAAQLSKMKDWHWHDDQVPTPIAAALDALDTDRPLAEFALTYLRAQAEYGPIGLRRRLAGHLHASESTVRDRLVAAAERGYLTSRGQGAAGRDPGPELQRIIATSRRAK